MLLAYAFDPIPILATIARKLFGDLIQSASRGPTPRSGLNCTHCNDVELVHLDHRFRQVLKCYAFAFGRDPASFTPSMLAFCRVAPSVRLSLRATTLVFVFSRTSVFKRRTSSFVHGRGFFVAFAIADFLIEIDSAAPSSLPLAADLHPAAPLGGIGFAGCRLGGGCRGRGAKVSRHERQASHH
jgi:hypothetical protein